MVKYLEIGEISRYHFIPLLVPLFCMTTNYIQKYQINYYNIKLRIINECPPKEYYSRNDKKCNIREYPFFLNIFVSKILAIFLFLYCKYLTHGRITSGIIESKPVRKYHTHFNSIRRKVRAMIYLILIGCLEIYFKFENYVTYNEPNYAELKLGLLLVVPLLYFCLLKKPVYRHHVLSLIISFIGVVLTSACLFFIKEDKNIFETKRQLYGEQIRHLFFSVYLSFSIVATKYLFEISFIDTYSFLTFDGFFCVLLPLLLILIKSFFIKEDENYLKENLGGILILFHDIKSVLYFIGLIISSFFYYLTNALTIYLFTPILLVSVDVVSPFFEWIIDLLILDGKSFSSRIKNENLYAVIPLKFFGFVLIGISALIINEILILNFCKFDKNVESNIKKRAIKDILKPEDWDLEPGSSLQRVDSTINSFQSKTSIDSDKDSFY